MKTKRHYYLMISCPGDVIRERELLKQCVEIVNKERDDDIWVELKYWVTDTFSDAGMPAQESINEQIVRDSDGLIAIFNGRLGTPVHNYACGTDEEISLMLKAGKHVSLLFNNRPVLDLTKPDVLDQLEKLIKYKAGKSSETYYRTFESESSFIDLAKQEIRLWLRLFANVESRDDKPNGENNESSIIAVNPISEQPTNASETTESFNEDELGIVDVMVEFTNSANAIAQKVVSFGGDFDGFSEETSAFAEQCQLLIKSHNISALRASCIRFSHRINEITEKTELFNGEFKDEWDRANRNLHYFSSVLKKDEDRRIMRENVVKLSKAIIPAYDSFIQLKDSIGDVQNIQKEFNTSKKGLVRAIEVTCSLLKNARDDCDALILEYDAIHD